MSLKFFHFKFLHRLSLLANIIATLLLWFPTGSLMAEEEAEQQEVDWKEEKRGKSATAKQEDPELENQQSKEGEKMRVASSRTVRRFHEVLDELLAEFGYDIKMGQINGLKNVSIRKVQVSESLPKTYENYLELLVAERVRENSRVKLISCVPCKTKSSMLVEGKLMISSATTNIERMNTAAEQLGIDNFMDVVLVYHTTHMVLAMQIFDTKSKEMVWTRTYNSETIKSRYQKLAIDYSQVAKSRPGEDYTPDYRLLFGIGGAGIPNVAGTTEDSTMINAQFRATERFDNRHSEFGLMLSILMTTNSLIRAYPTEGTEDPAANTEDITGTTQKGLSPKPFKNAICLYAIYGHNFLGSVESYNNVRQGLHTGLGALLATGYFAPIGRVGWDMYFGRRFVTSFSMVGIGPSQILVGTKTQKTKGGLGGDVILSFNF